MLLWLDLETTGLDPVKNRILEVAWTLTDGRLNPLNTEAEAQIQSRLIEPSLEAWDQLEEFNSELSMHIDSGLYDDLRASDNTVDLLDVEQQIINDIAGNMDGEPVYLAGASVHFDLQFIKQWMPRLAQGLSHRVYDTSTLKAFFDDFLVLPVELVNEHPHRAAHDVMEVIRVAYYYRMSLDTLVREALANEH